jgi:hypothetical protein
VLIYRGSRSIADFRILVRRSRSFPDSRAAGRQELIPIPAELDARLRGREPDRPNAIDPAVAAPSETVAED